MEDIPFRFVSGDKTSNAREGAGAEIKAEVARDFLLALDHA